MPSLQRYFRIPKNGYIAMMQTSRSREIVIHTIVVLMFLLSPFIFSPGPLDFAGIVYNQHVKRDFLSSILMLLFFYGNFYLFIPQLYFKKKMIPFASVAIVFLLFISLLPPYFFPFENLVDPPPPPPGDNMGLGRLFFEIGHQFFLFSATLLLSLTLKINGRWRITEKEKLNAELSYLKAQINPHFLFNTLNSIYSLSIIKSDKTPEAVVKLSGMMRYVLSDAHNNRVPLEKEIAYLGNYIDLQRIRLGNTVDLEYEVQGNSLGKEIAPLILITFVENAFKHGVNSEEDSSISIKLQSNDEEFKMNVRNNKVTSQISTDEKSGLGIENTKNRLNLLYPEQHELVIKDDGKTFLVSLKIKFDD